MGFILKGAAMRTDFVAVLHLFHRAGRPLFRLAPGIPPAHQLPANLHFIHPYGPSHVGEPINPVSFVFGVVHAVQTTIKAFKNLGINPHSLVLILRKASIPAISAKLHSPIVRPQF